MMTSPGGGQSFGRISSRTDQRSAAFPEAQRKRGVAPKTSRSVIACDRYRFAATNRGSTAAGVHYEVSRACLGAQKSQHWLPTLSCWPRKAHSSCHDSSHVRDVRARTSCVNSSLVLTCFPLSACVFPSQRLSATRLATCNAICIASTLVHQVEVSQEG